MAKKLNGTWKVIGLVVTLLVLFAGVVTTWAIYGKDIDENKKHISKVETRQDVHEDRLDKHDIAMVEIKYIREDMAEQKVMSKEILEEIKELQK